MNETETATPLLLASQPRKSRRCLPSIGRVATTTRLHSVKLFASRLGGNSSVASASTTSTSSKIQIQLNPQRRYQVLQSAADSQKLEERRRKTGQKIKQFLLSADDTDPFLRGGQQEPTIEDKLKQGDVEASQSVEPEEELQDVTNSSINTTATDSCSDSSFTSLRSNDGDDTGSEESWESHSQNQDKDEQQATPDRVVQGSGVIVEDHGEPWEASFEHDELTTAFVQEDDDNDKKYTESNRAESHEGNAAAAPDMAEPATEEEYEEADLTEDLQPTTTRAIRASRTPVLRPRPTVRLNLGRRRNWKYVQSHGEIQEWHQLMQWMAKRKKSLQDQRKTLHTLRKTCRMLDKPVRRGFVASFESNRDNIMFSIIHEEQEDQNQIVSSVVVEGEEEDDWLDECLKGTNEVEA
ncbi:expressed unknown protein [Seminavis robusta]|uniref:Uncharacterized protein n=1 Tax=Seminavis robusta TaxID=568900 RepID=A0A9N8H1F2_9STRA|nr:expressed unknown protein [Seminavis robusta]|eukprot:Sro3_g002320.1 n/a (410) ;mRNA; f:118875-120104